jgi:hypothetical protein
LLADEEKEHRTLQYNVQLKQMLIFTKTECLERELARVNKDTICLREANSSLEAKVERGEKEISSLREDSSSLREEMENFAEVLARHGLS